MVNRQILIVNRIMKAAAVMVAAMLLVSCSTPVKIHSEDFFSMDTYMRLTVYGDNSEAKAREAREIILRCEALYSATVTDSEVCKLNREGELTNPSEGLVRMLERAGELSEMSGGRYDLTVMPLMRLWGFAGDGENRVPGNEEIDGALSLVGMDNIRIEDGRVMLEDGCEIDLGSCAKGYAGNEAAKYLKSIGVRCAILTLGGNVQTVGRKPDGTDFVIGIADPFDTTSVLGTLEVGECAIVTSGTYQRNFTADGRTYSHLIDATTGRPCESGLVSVTVICADGMTADMLSTVFMLTGLELLESMYSENGGFEAVAVSENGTVSVTPGIRESFFPDDSVENVVFLK